MANVPLTVAEIEAEARELYTTTAGAISGDGAAQSARAAEDEDIGFQLRCREVALAIGQPLIDAELTMD